MKREKWLSGLIGAVLAFCIAFSGIGCLVTAFSLEAVDLVEIGLFCALCAVLACGCLSFRRGGLLLLAARAVLAGSLVREGTLALDLEALLYQISEFYDSGYGWGVISWSGIPLDGYEVTGGLTLLAGIVAIVVSWVVCHRKWAVFGIVAGFLPVAACCVVTDTVPEAGYLFWLLAAQVLLLLTQTVRRRSAADGVRLTALLVVPVLLASLLLFRLVPEDGYEIQANSIQQTLLNWFNRLPFIVQEPGGELSISFDGTVSSQVNLASVGPKAELRYAVMDVLSDRSETLYLRGQAFDVYDGKSWTASEEASGEDRYWPNQNLIDGGTVTVETRLTHQRLYAPYYPAEGQWSSQLVGGMLENTEQVKAYSFRRLIPSGNGANGKITEADALLNQCLALSADTTVAAGKILEQILPDGSYTDAQKLQIICSYVEGSAEYDLNTSRMPSDETDFAVWFLEDSDTGYCVHFATAATVLLRTAGIPARYVTGYTAEVQAGVRTTVTADKAHAWVEYFDRGQGCWMILDPTPADREEEPVPTEETEPEETMRPVETTEPEETTVETTQPDETEATAAPTEDQGGIGGPDDGNADIGWLWRTLAVLGCVLGAVAAVIGQYWIRRRLWKKRMYSGPNNRRAVWRWRYVGRMAKLTGKKPVERLEELAEKAMFSQHTLTADELMEFDAWLKEASRRLREKPWIQRVMIRLIWAIE